jgi:hypothetical protein
VVGSILRFYLLGMSLGLGGRNSSSNGLLDQILFVELGVGGFEIVVGLGDLDLLVLLMLVLVVVTSPSAATTSMLVRVRVLGLVLVLVLMVVTSTTTPGAIIRTHVAHLLCQGIYWGIRLLSTGLGQLRHSGGDGSSRSGGSISNRLIIGARSSFGSRNWDSRHHPATLVGDRCGGRADRSLDFSHRRLRLNRWGRGILGGRSCIPAVGLAGGLISSGEFRGGL